MLILFDIDGTILRTHGAGVKAMEEAGRELFGPQFCYQGIETPGRLDTLIWGDLCARNSIVDSPENHDRFRAEYGRRLRSHFDAGAKAALMPGVGELVRELATMKDITLGLLTGNYPETGRLKVANAGLDPELFVANAWAGDGPSRRHLPPVAMKQHRRIRGRDIEPHRVVIIGDTPHDVDCARHNGCRSIGVATGTFTVRQLEESGADLALENLAAREVVHAFLRKTMAAASE